MSLVDSTATFAAKIDGQLHPAFVHTCMLLGHAIGDAQTAFWEKQVQCICTAADLPTG